MAPRPPGGWQFGNRPRGTSSAVNRDAQGRRLLANGQVDDAPPDCYTVTRAGEGVFHIRHFREPEHKTPCCAMEVTRSPRDIAIAHAEGISVDVVTLQRAPECVADRRSAAEACA